MEEGSMPHIVVRPYIRSIGDHLKDALLLIYKHWAPLLVAQTITFFTNIFIVLLGLALFFTPVVYGVIEGMEGDQIFELILTGYFWLGLLVIIIPTILISVWGSIVMISSVGHKGEGMAPMSEVLKKGFTLLIPVFVLVLISSLVMMGAGFLLIFPAIILCTGLIFAMYIRILEDVPLCKAFGTSWQITKGYKWSILGRMMLLGGIVWGLMLVLAVGGMVPIMGIFAGLVQFAFGFVITPYIFAYIYCMYEDIREIRKDVYPMSGGLSVVMIIFAILSISFFSGLFVFGITMIRRYLM